MGMTQPVPGLCQPTRLVRLRQLIVKLCAYEPLQVRIRSFSWLSSKHRCFESILLHLKRILRLDRLQLTGPNGARDGFHLAAAAAQNLRKLAKLLPNGLQAMPA